MAGSVEASELLLRHGADLNVVDKVVVVFQNIFSLSLLLPGRPEDSPSCGLRFWQNRERRISPSLWN